MKIRKTFEDYLARGITPYGACLNTLDGIRIYFHGKARRRAEQILRSIYREYARAYAK